MPASPFSIVGVFALTSRELAPDHPSVKTAALGCKALPQYTCFNNSKHSLGRHSATADAGDCCALCHEHAPCTSFNHGCDAVGGQCATDSLYYCELFGTVGPTLQVDDGGCVGGISSSQLVASPPPPPRGDRPNIVWLVVESTDGRTWSPGYQQDVIPLPNIRKLQSGGLEFRRHYANALVCCPSRATFWSGRHAHNIPHEQAASGLPVSGAWNNYEGADLRLEHCL